MTIGGKKHASKSKTPAAITNKPIILQLRFIPTFLSTAFSEYVPIAVYAKTVRFDKPKKDFFETSACLRHIAVRPYSFAKNAYNDNVKLRYVFRTVIPSVPYKDCEKRIGYEQSRLDGGRSRNTPCPLNR